MKKTTKSRPVYRPPLVTRLGDIHPGAGLCDPGSGPNAADPTCLTGSVFAPVCPPTGAGLDIICPPTGAGLDMVCPPMGGAIT
jgi:hypothetical protein